MKNVHRFDLCDAQPGCKSSHSCKLSPQISTVTTASLFPTIYTTLSKHGEGDSLLLTWELKLHATRTCSYPLDEHMCCVMQARTERPDETLSHYLSEQFSGIWFCLFDGAAGITALLEVRRSRLNTEEHARLFGLKRLNVKSGRALMSTRGRSRGTFLLAAKNQWDTGPLVAII